MLGDQNDYELAISPTFTRDSINWFAGRYYTHSDRKFICSFSVTL